MKQMPICEYTCAIPKERINPLWLYTINYTEELYEIALTCSPNNTLYITDGKKYLGNEV